MSRKEDITQRLECTAKARKLDQERACIYLCTGEKGNCCTREQGKVSWEFLKRRIKELEIEGFIGVDRESSKCHRICTDGPIAKVCVGPTIYWYQQCTPEVLERILEEHIKEGKPVREYIFAECTLTPQATKA